MSFEEQLVDAGVQFLAEWLVISVMLVVVAKVFRGRRQREDVL